MRCQFTLRILWKTGPFELYVAVPAAEAIKEMMAIAIGSYPPLCVPQADTNKAYLSAGCCTCACFFFAVLIDSRIFFMRHKSVYRQIALFCQLIRAINSQRSNLFGQADRQPKYLCVCSTYVLRNCDWDSRNPKLSIPNIIHMCMRVW